MNPRKKWTAEDIGEIKRLAKARTPAGQIAHKLKRTEGAIRQKALTLNVSLNSRTPRPHAVIERIARLRSIAYGLTKNDLAAAVELLEAFKAVGDKSAALAIVKSLAGGSANA